MPEYALPTHVGLSPNAAPPAVTETIGLVLTALSAALFASGSFLLLALAFVLAAETRLGFPDWLMVGTVSPVVLVGLGIAIWMFRKAFDVERSLTCRARQLDVQNETTASDTAVCP